MPTIKTILDSKGSQVYSIGAQASILDAAKLMNEHKIGALVIAEHEAEGRHILGILTERDVLQRVVAEQRDPGATQVEDVMTRQVACCTIDTTIDEAGAIIRERRIRHLPVVDEENLLIGMISIGDLNAHRLDGQAATIQHLHEYLYGQDESGQWLHQETA